MDDDCYCCPKSQTDVTDEGLKSLGMLSSETEIYKAYKKQQLLVQSTIKIGSNDSKFYLALDSPTGKERCHVEAQPESCCTGPKYRCRHYLKPYDMKHLKIYRSRRKVDSLHKKLEELTLKSVNKPPSSSALEENFLKEPSSTFYISLDSCFKNETDRNLMHKSESVAEMENSSTN